MSFNNLQLGTIGSVASDVPKPRNEDEFLNLYLETAGLLNNLHEARECLSDNIHEIDIAIRNYTFCQIATIIYKRHQVSKKMTLFLELSRLKRIYKEPGFFEKLRDRLSELSENQISSWSSNDVLMNLQSNEIFFESLTRILLKDNYSKYVKYILMNIIEIGPGSLHETRMIAIAEDIISRHPDINITNFIKMISLRLNMEDYHCEINIPLASNYYEIISTQYIGCPILLDAGFDVRQRFGKELYTFPIVSKDQILVNGILREYTIDDGYIKFSKGLNEGDVLTLRRPQ